MSNSMKSFNNMIREIYDTQLTFICYLRKKLIDAGFIKADSLWICGLDEKLHCRVDDQSESPLRWSVNFSIDSPEYISLECPSIDFSIKFHILHGVIWHHSTNMGKMEKDKCEIFCCFIRDIIDKWCDYQSCYCKVMDDKRYECHTPDYIWNKMKRCDEPYEHQINDIS